MDPTTLRLTERILDVLIGGISIYLGYRLFLALPEKTDSNGKFVLPGNISVHLSRVGPGIFFALFGAIVVALSLHDSIQYRDPTMQFSGMSLAASAPDRPPNEVARGLLREDMALLNALPAALKTNLATEARVRIEQAIPRVKLALMKGAWGEDWGDMSAFERWVREGSVMPPPAGLEKAAEYYSYEGGKLR